MVGRVVKEFNAIDLNSEVKDNFGHGTAVAGIIAANDNTKGIVGLVPSIDIYSVKVLSDKGKGDLVSLTRAVDWAIENNVDIINISFGISHNKPELEQAIDKAVDSGIIIVASAGNTFGIKTEYPARYSNVISVNSVNAELKKPSFSAHGKIDFVGPGTDIITTIPNNKYDVVEGTSFATAHVTGIIAYLLANDDTYSIPNKHDSRYFNKVYQVLKEHSFKLGDSKIYGNGFIQLKGDL